jgi:hypothetical protein
VTQSVDDTRGRSFYHRTEVERIALNWFLWGFSFGGAAVAAGAYLFASLKGWT